MLFLYSEVRPSDSQARGSSSELIRKNGWEVKKGGTWRFQKPATSSSSQPSGRSSREQWRPHHGPGRKAVPSGRRRSSLQEPTKPSSSTAPFGGPGPVSAPLTVSYQLPAGLERRVALRQNLEAALEEPHVPVSQEIQPLSLSAPRRPLILRGRHTATETTSAATRKQLAHDVKETREATPGWRVWEGACVRPRPSWRMKQHAVNRRPYAAISPSDFPVGGARSCLFVLLSPKLWKHLSNPVKFSPQILPELLSSFDTWEEGQDQ